jgi:outer membrane protein
LAFAHVLCAPFAALAAEPAGQTFDPPPESGWGLGVAVISTQKAYKGIDRDNVALPLVYFENRWVRLFGPGVEFKLPSLDLSASQKVDFRLVAKYDRSGYDSDDAPVLSGMEERKDVFWAGAKVTWRNDVADISAEVLADASNHSKGRRATLGLERTFRLGQHVMFVPRVSATWLSDKYVDYYYGVRDTEIRADRPAYSGKSAVNAELGARATYLFNAAHSVFVDVGVTRLAKEMKNSPLVERSTESRVAAGYLYRF